MSRPLQSLEYLLCGHRIQLWVPSQPEQILADAVTGNSQDPYWGQVWDSAPLAAKCVLRTRWPDNTRAIELGCGCGLLGIAAMLAGMRVTLSDHDAEAVNLAVANARLNGLEDAQGMVLDWNDPGNRQFDVLLASDVLYESELHEPLLHVAARMLNENGSLRIGDPGRRLARAFLERAVARGWAVEIYDADLQPVPVPGCNDFQWLVLRR